MRLHASGCGSGSRRAALRAAGWCGAAIACACSEPDTISLAELAARHDVYVAVEQHEVACRCPGIHLLGCSASCATDIEVYALVIAREGVADGEGCEPRLDADAHASGGQVGEVEITSECHETRFEWDGHGAPTRITIEDDTATWTLTEPFVQPSVELVSPAEEDLGRGAAVRIEVAGVSLRDATARITPYRGSEAEAIAVAVEVEHGRAEFALADDLPSGPHDLSFSSGTELLPAACAGPPACRGFSVHERWTFSVPPDPIRDDRCDLIADTVCANDLACYVAGPAGETQCLTPGTTSSGAFCELSSECAPGTGCHPSRGEAQRKQCYELCEVLPTDSRSTCPEASRCAWLNAPGHPSLGACVEEP